MTSLATGGDFDLFWPRPLTAAQSAAAGPMLEIASAIVRARIADVDERIAAGTLAPSLAAFVVVQIVGNYLSNRDPDAPIQERIGEASQTWSAAARAEMTLADVDAALLLDLGTTATRGRTIALGLAVCPP